LISPSGLGLTIGSCVVEIIVIFALVCCYGRTHPINLILLAVFTLCESFIVGGLTSFYEPKTVILAGTGTALVTVSLTFYAMTTKVSIEIF
jgi:FtsH-binding integral membrane protein